MNELFKSSDSTQNMGVLPNVNFLTTLRNSGYNNYNAIADIVDNSLDDDVESKNVWVTIKSKLIRITDDGLGMNQETLNEALKLGSITGKDASINLGNYGTGLKSAFLSMGRKLVIRTKEPDGDFIIGIFDYDKMINENIWFASIGVGSNEEYEKFRELTGCDHGTVIEISNLDRITNNSTTSFRDTLINKFALIYNYLIKNTDVNIFVNNLNVKPFDPMFRHEKWSKRLSELNESFEFKGKTYKFNAFNIEGISGEESKNIGRNRANAGLYIYRNFRLVGEGLGLGIIDKHGDGHLNGYRVELFIDGDDDRLFDTSFLKIITEKDKNEIDQGFKDKIKNALNQYTNAARTLNKNKNDKEEKNDKDVKKVFDRTFEEINKKKWFKGKGKNKKNNGTKIDPKNPGRNKYSPRNRGFVKWEFGEFGENGNVCKFGFDEGKHVIYWNTDHIFYKDFLKKYAKQDNSDVVGVINKFFVAMAIARDEKLDYFNNGEISALIDEYEGEFSSSLRKLMNVYL